MSQVRCVQLPVKNMLTRAKLQRLNSAKFNLPPETLYVSYVAPTNNILVTYGALQVLYCIVLYCIV